MFYSCYVQQEGIFRKYLPLDLSFQADKPTQWSAMNENRNSHVRSYWIDTSIAVMSIYLELNSAVMSWNHSASIIVQ